MNDTHRITDSDILRQVEGLEPQAQHKYPPKSASPENIRRGRFGIALFLAGMFALVCGLYVDDMFIRRLLIFAALVCVLFGAFFIDSANKSLARREQKKR